MPIYLWRCVNKHEFEAYLPVSRYDEPQNCPECGMTGRRVITAPILVIVSPDVHYTSPIDGKPITSMAARKEDLAQSGCIEYDPEMKKDAERYRIQQDQSLEKAVDETVDREITQMPVRKREKLEAELQGGMTVETARVTPQQKSFRK